MQLYNFNITYYRYDDDHTEQLGVHLHIDAFSRGWHRVDGENVPPDDRR